MNKSTERLKTILSFPSILKVLALLAKKMFCIKGASKQEQFK